MKTQKPSQTSKAILAALLCANISISVGEETHDHHGHSAALIKEQPHAIYHVIQNKTLTQAIKQISARSLTEFKIDPSLTNDIINKKIAAEDWNEAIKQLLAGYNYTSITNGNTIKIVVVSGRNGNASADPATTLKQADQRNFVSVSPLAVKKMPNRYKGFNQGSVSLVSIPMKELNNVRLNEDVTLDLPNGQYKIRHDAKIDHGNDGHNWIGYLEDEGKGYRIYLSEGKAGVIGSMFTPDGEYRIETVNGQTYFVDMSKSGLTATEPGEDGVDPSLIPGVANDLSEPEPAVGANTAALSIKKQVMDKAQSDIDAIVSANPWLQKFQSSDKYIDENLVKISQKNEEIKALTTKLTAVKQVYAKTPKLETIPELTQQINDVQLSIKQTQLAQKTIATEYQSAIKPLNASLAALKKVLATLNADLKKNPSDDTIKSNLVKATADIKQLTDDIKLLTLNYQTETKGNSNVVATLTKQIAIANAALKKAPKTQESIALEGQIKSITDEINLGKQDISKNNLLISNEKKDITKFKSGLLKDQGKPLSAKLAEYAKIALNLSKAKINYNVELAKNQTPTTTSVTTQTPASITTTVNGTPIIDLMVVYTTEKQTSTEAKQKINLLVDITNQSYVDSNINAKVRLVHTRPTSDVPGTAIKAIKEKTDNGAVLPTLATNADIKTLRAAYGADLVMLFKPYYAQTSTTCGVAYIATNGTNGKLSTSSYRGYSVVNDGYSKDAVTNRYCENNTFAHEIGHNLGNDHERENSSGQGVYPYSYAWGIANSFGTIMGYKRPRVMVYSTPELATQCKGVPCGYAAGSANESDQAKSMRLTIPQVSGYYATKIEVPDIQ